MTVYNFDTEEDFDAHLEMIEEVNYQYTYLQEAVKKAEKELSIFEENNKEFIIN